MNPRPSILAMPLAAGAMFLAAACPAVAQPSSVSGAPAQVGVGPGSFSPKVATIYYYHAFGPPDSGTVKWSFENSSSTPMSVTDSTGLGLYNTGSHSAGYSLTYIFKWAGTFPYHSVPTPAVGAIRSDMVRSPGTAPLGSAITFKWASAGRTNCVFDVEIKHQGQLHWAYMRFATTALSTAYTPKKTGWIEVRARIRNKNTNKSSGFSPSVLVHIT